MQNHAKSERINSKRTLSCPVDTVPDYAMCQLGLQMCVLVGFADFSGWY
jgi:hypothetical protein